MTLPRVLVVDDDPGVLKSLRLLLEDDCEVVCVGEPLVALVEAELKPFDVVITDLRMPRMNGGESARELKARVKPTPYLLMLTGTPNDVTHSTPGGQDLVMVFAKPYDPERLLRMVGQLGRLGLARRQATAA